MERGPSWGAPEGLCGSVGRRWAGQGADARAARWGPSEAVVAALTEVTAAMARGRWPRGGTAATVGTNPAAAVVAAPAGAGDTMEGRESWPAAGRGMGRRRGGRDGRPRAGVRRAARNRGGREGGREERKDGWRPERIGSSTM